MAAEESLPVRPPRGSDRYASELQRARLLSATFSLVGDGGYEAVTARSVSARAGMSNRTFYEVFTDREDCFLAAFNHALEGLELEVRAGWESELGWTARVRAALTALLQTLDREPAVGRLVFVDALAAGPRVLARRARVLEGLAGVVDEGRANAKAPATLPPLVAEGVVGATFGVIHARLLELRPEPLVELLGALMATIVLPYRGSAAAARELSRRARATARGRTAPPIAAPRPSGSAFPVDYRLTVRTQMALAAVAGVPGLNNREVSEVIGLADQGQISRMMKRLCDQGLIEDAQGHTNRQVKAWRLTSDGEAVIDAHKPLKQAQRKAGKGGKLATTRSAAGRKGKHEQIAAAGTDRPRTRIRMTVLTRRVLTTVAELSEWGANPTNRKIAIATNVKDEGQISKLLARLEKHGLLQNTGGPTKGANAWRLTPRGAELLHASKRPTQPRGKTR